MDVFNLLDDVLLDEQLYFNVADDKLKKSFIMLNRTYNRKALKKCKTYVNYHFPSDRCAYLYKFGLCHTQLVSVYFRKFLKNARTVYSILKNKDELKICSLGGGPGTDVLGMFSVLVSYKDLWAKLSEVTVLDVCGGWRNTFKRVMNVLEVKYPVQKNLLTNLVNVDLMGTLSPPAIKAIEEADILCMVKFVSTVISHPTAKSAFKELASHMKVGAVVIFIDNLDNRIFKPLKKYFKESGFKHVFTDFCDHFQVKGSFPSSFKDVEGSETMEYASVYVLGWIKESLPEWSNIHQGNVVIPLQNALYSSNSENNYPESDGDNDFNSDDLLSSADGEQFDTDQDTQTIQCSQKLSNSPMHDSDLDSIIDLDEIPIYEDEQKLSQGTQTVENSGGLLSHLGKNGIFDNLSNSKLCCDVPEEKLCADKCTQTAEFLCDRSSFCVNCAHLEGLGCQLSRIMLRLSRMEFLIENIAVGSNKKLCDATTCCSAHHILRSNNSDKCHCCFNHKC